MFISHTIKGLYHCFFATGPTEAAKLGRTTYLVNKDASAFFTAQDNE